MSLTADPSVTYGASGNVLATTTSISAGASNTGNIVDFSTNTLGGWVQVTETGGGTVASTNGCQVSIYPAGDSTPHYDSSAMWTYIIPTLANSVSRQSILLPTGKYSITLTNLDATNAITAGITSSPLT